MSSSWINNYLGLRIRYTNRGYMTKWSSKGNNVVEVISLSAYIKKPIKIDAIQYKEGLEDGFDELDKALENGLNRENYESPVTSGLVPYIITMEGKHYIQKGDYIITGVEGERYPCKKDIFQKTYEPVN